MSEKYICQSCGMPMDDSYFAKNPDGTVNKEYCSYCYKDGEFIGAQTLDEMVNECIPFAKKKYPDPNETRKAVREELLQLKRWRS